MDSIHPDIILLIFGSITALVGAILLLHTRLQWHKQQQTANNNAKSTNSRVGDTTSVFNSSYLLLTTLSYLLVASLVYVLIQRNTLNMDNVYRQLNNVDFSDLNPQQVNELHTAIIVIDEEAHQPIYKVFTSKNLKSLSAHDTSLIHLLDDYLYDGKLQADEFHAWMHAFQTRTLSDAAFDRMLSKLQQVSKMPHDLELSRRIYQAYQHRGSHYALYEDDEAFMKTAHGQYLKPLLHWIDRVIAEQVEALRWFQTGGNQGQSYQQYRQHMDALMAELTGLEAPASLQQVQQLIETAVSHQAAFFYEWDLAQQSKRPFPFDLQPGNPVHPLIKASSQALKQAHKQLSIDPEMKGESKNNKRAIYNHLQTLDMI